MNMIWTIHKELRNSHKMSLTQMFQHLAKQIVFDRRCMPGFKISVAYTIFFIIIIIYYQKDSNEWSHFNNSELFRIVQLTLKFLKNFVFAILLSRSVLFQTQKRQFTLCVWTNIQKPSFEVFKHNSVVSVHRFPLFLVWTRASLGERVYKLPLQNVSKFPYLRFI